MRPSDVFVAVFRFLLPPALIGTVYLYLYPAILQCSFPPAKHAEASCYIEGTSGAPAETAPFRLLALADPQLEGDTSLSDPNAPLLPSLERIWQDGFTTALRSVATEDVPRILQTYRKKLDLWGNDLYLAHIYRSVHWWTQPTHTVVLGDLLGSQWIGDDEFARRSRRFWDAVFKGGELVPRDVTDTTGRVELLGQDSGWKRRVIAVAGNHDIGYAGDINERRIERFEDAFGSVNWEITFRLNHTSGTTPAQNIPFGSFPASPELRLVILNSMNLDEPALKPALRQQSLDFLADQLSQPQASNSATVLLTHIPLHKEAGVCVDAPYFSYFPSNQGGGIREQNHLRQETSAYILEGLLSGSGNAIVLNGHDHEGCDTYHYRLREPGAETSDDDQAGGHAWHAKRYHLSSSQRSGVNNGSFMGLREITVQSMMGSYSGNACLLSGWFDAEAGQWRFEYDTCVVGVQHIWWAVHILDLIVAGLGLAGILNVVLEAKADSAPDGRKVKRS